MASDTPRTVAVCEKLIAWATKNPNATIGDAAKFIVETFTEDMAEVERELNEARAENAKLRGALRRIADWGCIDAKQWDGPCASALCEVAKAALDFPKETDK